MRRLLEYFHTCTSPDEFALQAQLAALGGREEVLKDHTKLRAFLDCNITSAELGSRSLDQSSGGHVFVETDADALQGYLVTLVDAREVVARVARRFMPRLKTESEVATMRYLREHTSIPVPEVYQYDSNPYNRLGGEYILMSKVCFADHNMDACTYA